jgi:glycosyltransferase involved in cell wall biosynthesis
MKKSKPLISIIIPSLNHGNFIERAILSVLKQDYENKEVIVADGGSKDQTIDILRKYEQLPEFRYFSEKDEGYADAVNKAVKLSRGSIIGIQSADDYYNEHAISEAVDIFTKYPDAALLTGNRVFLNEEGQDMMRSSNQSSFWIDFWDIVEYHWVPAQDATFVRRKAIASAGELNKEIDYCADIDLWTRILAMHCGLKVGRFWSFRQFHSNQRYKRSLDKFADDWGKIMSFWAFNLPRALVDANREKINAFCLFRQAAYHDGAGESEQARDKIASAYKLFPAFYCVKDFKELCTKFKIKIDMNSNQQQALVTRMRPKREIEINYPYNSNQDPLWYTLTP